MNTSVDAEEEDEEEEEEDIEPSRNAFSILSLKNLVMTASAWSTVKQPASVSREERLRLGDDVEEEEEVEEEEGCGSTSKEGRSEGEDDEEAVVRNAVSMRSRSSTDM